MNICCFLTRIHSGWLERVSTWKVTVIHSLESVGCLVLFGSSQLSKSNCQRSTWLPCASHMGYSVHTPNFWTSDDLVGTSALHVQLVRRTSQHWIVIWTLVLQRRPTCSCYVVMPFSGTSISSPQFSLQCVQLRLKVTMWLVLNQRSFKRVSGLSDKLIVWQAHQWLSPSRKKSRPARRRHPRRLLLGLPCLTGWAPLHPQRRGWSNRSRPFELVPEGPVHDPSKEARSLASLLLLPQPRNVDGPQVGARLADFAPHWRSLLGNCRATGIVEDGVGIAFQQRPQLTHQSISFRTRNSRQDLQQAVDALLMKGAIERVTNVKSLGFYSRLFLVPKKTGDLRPVIDLSTLNRHMVVPHFKIRVATRQGKVRENFIFSRSGNCQGIWDNVREILKRGKCQGKVREFHIGILKNMLYHNYTLRIFPPAIDIIPTLLAVVYSNGKYTTKFNESPGDQPRSVFLFPSSRPDTDPHWVGSKSCSNLTSGIQIHVVVRWKDPGSLRDTTFPVRMFDWTDSRL